MQVITIGLDAWRHWLAVERSVGPMEVSALGLTSVNDPLHIEEFFVPKQTCTEASTIMDRAAVGDLTIDLCRRGIDPSRLRVWVHSHNRMGVFWSNTDDGNIRNFLQDPVPGDYILSIVTNLAGEVKARIDTFFPAQSTTEAFLYPKFVISAEEMAAVKEMARRVTYQHPGIRNLVGSGAGTYVDYPGSAKVYKKSDFFDPPKDLEELVAPNVKKASEPPAGKARPATLDDLPNELDSLISYLDELMANPAFQGGAAQAMHEAQTILADLQEEVWNVLAAGDPSIDEDRNEDGDMASPMVGSTTGSAQDFAAGVDQEFDDTESWRSFMKEYARGG